MTNPSEPLPMADEPVRFPWEEPLTSRCEVCGWTGAHDPRSVACHIGGKP